MEISKSELKVLNALWQSYPCSASEIVDRLDNQLEWHEKTVKTLLGRLVKKQAISFQKDGRRYLYSPLIEQKDFQQTESKHFLDRIFGGRVSPLIASFANQEKLKQEDIDQLKKIISDWEKDND
ncbi:BlaI/MecI/CopY family transcriptional regulator [Aliiglaciecola lipolytica]|uniref:Transcriptional regulator, BlaI family protein n=1 Tax=Aliiglaciecola lipolytica E3 TaxID=1127673 RepID=K6Y7V5_9ALTE|nr:BlaI/MecI/CopY family transcriptional regulator [Aliiglaciecola lipolytica]GAC12748.1 transcriptional regulator, BlaI family protein [Aliiglaciecola lipolytica E3]